MMTNYTGQAGAEATAPAGYPSRQGWRPRPQPLYNKEVYSTL